MDPDLLECDDKWALLSGSTRVTQVRIIRWAIATLDGTSQSGVPGITYTSNPTINMLIT